MSTKKPGRRSAVRAVWKLTRAAFLALPLAAGWIAWRDGQPLVHDLAPTEVAVRIDEWSGATTVHTEPGLITALPVLQSLYVLDKRDVTFRMEGGAFREPNHVPSLTVRSADGSEFWFEELEILYRLRADRADRVLLDSGPGEGYRERWMQGLARAVLRDEFGRLATQESASSERAEAAKQRAIVRLGELLESHGLEVLQITTPKPQFDRNYEKAIEDRKVLEQEAERLRGDLEEVEALRPQALAAAERAVELERERRAAELERKLLEAEAAEIEARAAADRYAFERDRAAQVVLDTTGAERATLEAALRADADVLRAEVTALAEFGELAVRREVIDLLQRTELEMRPIESSTDAREVGK